MTTVHGSADPLITGDTHPDGGFGQKIELSHLDGTLLSIAPSAALGTAQKGITAIARRADTPAALSDASGDAEPLTVDALGRLWAHINYVDDFYGRTGGQAFVNATASGSTQVVAGVATKKIAVVSFQLVNNTATQVDVKFLSNAGAISAVWTLAAGPTVGLERTGSPLAPLHVTNAGEALNINLSGALTGNGVAVDVVYTLV